MQAKLHVNQFLLANNPATDGFLFRTDGNSSQTNMWQMFTGTSATAQTEKFRLFVPANSTNVILRSSQPNANMQFQTTDKNNTSVVSMSITDQQVVIHNALVLKAQNSNDYFIITVNSNGALSTKKIELTP